MAILSVALLAAVASWWFRYTMTHRSADFWGPATAQLIRDASVVQFWPLQDAEDLEAIEAAEKNAEAVADPAMFHDVTTAPGLVHMRTALLDDRSFSWPAIHEPREVRWKWALRFRDGKSDQQAVILVAENGEFVADFDDRVHTLSAKPIAEGLRKMIGEFQTHTQGRE